MPLASFLLQSRLDFPGQRAEIGNSLQFVIRELDAKMVFQFRQQVERLQAVDTERFEEIVVGRKLFARHFEVGGGEVQDFVERLV
jgi:hypothetical protein